MLDKCALTHDGLDREGSFGDGFGWHQDDVRLELAAFAFAAEWEATTPDNRPTMACMNAEQAAGFVQLRLKRPGPPGPAAGSPSATTRPSMGSYAEDDPEEHARSRSKTHADRCRAGLQVDDEDGAVNDQDQGAD